ncbi:MAG TPA: DNA gyrase C-terminal beta-propeller domain-containing protein, partial [Cellvibrio sp.]
SASPAEAKDSLMGRGWNAAEMAPYLERAGEDACRPEDLGPEFGMRDGHYYLSAAQAQAILELRLHRLTGMEHDKLLAEYDEKLIQIAEFLEILGNALRLMEVIREELTQVINDYGDKRRTEIVASTLDLTTEDLINVEDRVVTISHGGYAKSQPLDDYQAQRRGGMGKSATAVKDEDYVQHLLIASTHDTVLLFTNAGKVYWLKVYMIPVAGRQSRGRPVINLLPSLEEGERITSILPVKSYDDDKFIFMTTANGTVKKTALTQFSRQRSVGLRAIELDEGDTLVGTAITNGSCDVILFSSSGKAARFRESQVRAMGRTSRGVRGIRLAEGQRVVGMVIPMENGQVLTVSENGYGKRTEVGEFPAKGRGSQGVIGMQTTERNGQLVGAVQVFDGEEIMLISDQGTMVRTRVDEVSVLSRNTQGVRLIKLKEGERMQGLERIEENVDENAKRELARAEAAEGEEALEDGVAADDVADDIVDDVADDASDE